MSNAPPSRDRRSLQDLAKLANSPTLGGAAKTPPPPSVKPPPVSAKTPPPPPVSADGLDHDSGIVDLKGIAKADEEAEIRAQSTPLASAPLFDEETPSRPPPAGPSSGALAGAGPASSVKGAKAAPVSAQPPSASGQRAKASAVAAVAAPAEKKGPVVWIVGALALGAIVAGALFLRASSQHAASHAPAPAEPTANAPAAAAPTPPAPSAVAAATPAPAEPAAAPEPEPDSPSNAEPTKGAAAGGHAAIRRGSAGGKAHASAGGGSTVSGLSSMMAQAATPAADTPAAPPAPPAAAGALGDSMQHAVGATGASKAATEAAPAAPRYAPGSVPDKPSQGAVTSALGVVLPGARDCLSPDDPISRAHITFSSSGSVSVVTVTGHAAGTPVEGCIKGALLKASIPPFAEGTFGATVTIRPN